jgi:beta-glucanase (GH16 family)
MTSTGTGTAERVATSTYRSSLRDRADGTLAPMRNAFTHGRGKLFVVLLLGVTALVGVVVVMQGSRGSDPVAFFDDFDGPAGYTPDARLWRAELGAGGWGNNELQEYTNAVENLRLDGAGNLVIEARRSCDSFTSAKINTKETFAFTYGRAEARIRFPAGAGLHSAFWLLGTDIDEVNWPRSGEIDVVEVVNDATGAFSALHGPVTELGTDPDGRWAQGRDVVEDMRLADDFHVYWVERKPGEIRMGVDEETTAVFTPATLGAEQQWVFEKPFYAILNVAVGGNWPGAVGADTVFPATMLVDWVRIEVTG